MHSLGSGSLLRCRLATPFVCRLCGIAAKTKQALSSHERSLEHRQRQETSLKTYYKTVMAENEAVDIEPVRVAVPVALALTLDSFCWQAPAFIEDAWDEVVLEASSVAASSSGPLLPNEPAEPPPAIPPKSAPPKTGSRSDRRRTNRGREKRKHRSTTEVLNDDCIFSRITFGNYFKICLNDFKLRFETLSCASASIAARA